MTAQSAIPIALVAGPRLRGHRFWAGGDAWSIRPYERRAFSPSEHLTADIPVVLYEAGARLADTCRFLDLVAQARHDACVIVLGRAAKADHVAHVLRHGAFDYVTWPCSPSRLKESIAAGLANRRAFLQVRDLSDELARANQALAQDRNMLAACNRTLAVLHQLTNALAASLDQEAIVSALFSHLRPWLHPASLALARTDPESVWIWSPSSGSRGEAGLRARVLAQLPRTPSWRTSTNVPLRLVHSSGSLARADRRPAAGPGGPYRYQVPLCIGPHAAGLLHVERAEPFTDQEQQLLTTAGASLALALRNADSYQQIQQAALRDPLTEVLNRRALDGPLTREWRAGLRYGTPACLLLLDLDYFKTVNDVLGHVAGDEVLRQVARLVQNTVREVDSVVRYGGEEFAIVLPHTDVAQARRLAERIRAAVERQAFRLADGHARLTVSIGLASVRGAHIRSTAHWIAAADAALYAAKSQGRNQVVTHHAGAPVPPSAAALCGAA